MMVIDSFEKCPPVPHWHSMQTEWIQMPNVKGLCKGVAFIYHDPVHGIMEQITAQVREPGGDK